MKNGSGSVRGVTLMELVVVMSLLVLAVGMVAYRLSPDRLSFGVEGDGKTAARIATETTMKVIRDAMMGGGERAGYWEDMGRDMLFFPVNLEWLMRRPTDAGNGMVLSAVEERYRVRMQSYDGLRGMGWRGPYARFRVGALVLDEARGYGQRLVGDGTRMAPLDGWGRGIVLQWPVTGPAGEAIGDVRGLRRDGVLAGWVVANARLVSAGPDGILQTELNRDRLGTPESFRANPDGVGDDVVMWLRR
jgi:hypothetical protein